MADLPLTNVINVSVSQAQLGVNAFNTSNLAIFTHEPPAVSFGSLGYQLYLSPQQVATDFGTSSQTYAMANGVFSQQPNILAGNGSLVVIPFVEAQQTLAFSGVAASGTFVFNWGGHASAAINWNDTAAQIQAKIQAITGLGSATVTGSIASESLIVSFLGVYGAAALATITSDTLQTAGSVAITVTPSTTQVGETMAAAITRTENLVQYFGCMATVILSQTDNLAAAAVIQALNKLFFTISTTAADVSPGGNLALITSGGFTQTRPLYYNDSAISMTLTSDALVMMASYAGLGLSTNFNGSNTTQTLHLKGLNGVQPDSSMTQSLLALCQTAGVDVYISLQGVPKLFISGANQFFDQVYNLQWIVGAFQVAGFNYLAQASTKIPQTENGMNGLKNAYRQICEQGVTNQYLAPGTWNSSTTFGNQTNFLNNIAARGYYIYSAPISQQLQTARAARQAPLVQIALKQAGAIHSSSILINVNA